MIGMFGLFKRPAFIETLKIDELDYLYIHPSFRGMGAGTAVINIAKSLSRQRGSDLILLETQSPLLNRMYEKLGAKVICDSWTFGDTPTIENTLLRL